MGDKNPSNILSVVIIILIIGIGVYFYSQSGVLPKTNETTESSLNNQSSLPEPERQSGTTGNESSLPEPERQPRTSNESSLPEPPR